MKTVTLYSGAAGINNKVPAYRLPFSADTGVSALESAENVIIDRTGQVVSRRGYSEILAGSYHSLLGGKTFGLVVHEREIDSAIMRIDSNLSLVGLRSGLSLNRRMDYCAQGGIVFYTNSEVTGMIKDGASIPWKESSWEDSKTIAGFEPPPPAEHLAYNAGRIYFSRDNLLSYTEFARLGLYDPASDGEQFLSRVIMIIKAVDGLYVSTEDAVYFLSGLNPSEWASREVLSYPAIEWAKYQSSVDPSFFGFETNVPSALIGTVNGPVLLMPSGQVVNLIDKNVAMPSCSKTGSIGLFDESLIIQSGE